MDIHEDQEKDYRIRQDLKRHNWLLIKLDKKLHGDKSQGKIKPIAKSAPNLRPTLPVCLPLSHHHKYLKNKNCQENSLLTKHTEKKSLTRPRKKELICGSSNDNSQESIDCSKLENTVDSLTHDNNAELINDNKSTDNLNLEAYATIQPLHVIQINLDYDKYKIPVLVKEVSVQVPKNDELSKNINSQEPGKTKIPIPLCERSTQTDQIAVIYGEDVELLRTVKDYNFTLKDLERFNQIIFQTNNNQAEFENQNEENIELNEDKDESIQSEQRVSDNNNNSVENTSNSDLQISPNKPLSDLNGQLINRHYQSSSLATGLFERLKLWSDLNKVILRTFYEGVLLGKENGHDKVNMENHLSQLSQNLVDQICDMVTTYNEAYGRPIGRVLEIIGLDNCDDHDNLLGNRLSHTDIDTTKRIIGTRKIGTDEKQHQEYPVNDEYNDESSNPLSQNQEIEFKVTPVVETQPVLLLQECEQENQNEVSLNLITQDQESNIQETSVRLSQYEINPDTEIQNQQTQCHEKVLDLHDVTEIQMNPNQVAPDEVAENPINKNPMRPPTRPQILQNQLLPKKTFQNVLALVNEDTRVQNQVQNTPQIYQETPLYTEIVTQRTTVLREFGINSMPVFPVDESNKNDSRLHNYFNSNNDQPIENTLYAPRNHNIWKEQKTRKRPFHHKPYSIKTSRYYDLRQNISSPINTSYKTSNRTIHNVIQQNPQYYSANYHTYQYNYRNFYAGDYRRW